MDNVDAWTKLAMKEPEDIIFVFDDLSAQLEHYTRAAQTLLWRQIAHITWRRRDTVFVFSPEHAGELLTKSRRGTSCSEVIPGDIHTFYIADYSKPADIERVVRREWKNYAKSRQIIFQTKEWSDYRLVHALDVIPVYSNLRPVNYRTLEGLQLSEPKKSLSVLNAVIEKAKESARGHVPCVSDSMFDEVVGSVTGFPIGHGKDHFDSVVSGVTEGQCFNQRGKPGPANVPDIFEQLVIRVNLLSLRFFSDEPAHALCIGDHEKRRRFSHRLAEKLLGSKEAVLIMDYESILDQIVDALLYPTPIPFVGCLGRCKGFHGG